MGAFKEPHGGELKDLYLSADEAESEKEAAGSYASWDLTERQLCDIELLLKCTLRRPDSITRVPVAWVDSEKASTTTDLEPYLEMLQAVARMYRHYGGSSNRSEEFARLVEGMSRTDWQKMVASVPAAIVSREPHEYATWAGVDAAELEGSIA